MCYGNDHHRPPRFPRVPVTSLQMSLRGDVGSSYSLSVNQWGTDGSLVQRDVYARLTLDEVWDVLDASVAAADLE